MLLITGFGLGCLAVIFLIIARDFGRMPVAQACLTLLIATGAFLLDSIIHHQWKWLTSDIMTMLPAIFWLLCQLAFARRPRLVSVWAALALYSFITPALCRPFDASNELTGHLHIWGWKLPTYAEYIVILHGMWVVVANWSDDLISSRRKLRGFLLGIIGFSALWVTGSLNSGYGSNNSLPAIVCIAALIIAHLLLKGREGVLLGLSKPSNQETPNAHTNTSTNTNTNQQAENSTPNMIDDSDLNKYALKLQQIMSEGFYRTEKLTIQKLSKKIGLPEYKTRALINQTLAYRNFNDYINQLRIAEAGRRLISEPETPVLNIALDVGYRTLSSFNRAFKEIFDQSPTAYRSAKNAHPSNTTT